MLTKANGVDSIVQCWAPQLNPPSYMYQIYPEREADLVGWGWMVKPWAVAHATLSELLDEARFIKRVNVGVSNVHVLCFRRPSGMFVAAWCSQGSARVSNPFARTGANFMSIVGQPLSSGADILLTESPVYIESGTMSQTDFLHAIQMVNLAGSAVVAPPNGIGILRN